MNWNQYLEKEFELWDRRNKNDMVLSQIRGKFFNLLVEIIKKRNVSEADVKNFNELEKAERECYEEWRTILEEDNKLFSEKHKIEKELGPMKCSSCGKS